MDMQNVSNLQISEGAVRTIHDKDNRLIWGCLAYDTEYAGNTLQQTYSGKNLADFTTISFGDTNYGTGTRAGQTYTVTSTTNAFGGIYFEQTNLLLEPSTTYTFSAKVVSTTATNGSSVYILGTMNTAGNNIAGNLATAGNITSATFTTPSTIPNNARITLYVRQQNASTVFTDLQIEKNGSATSWEPYTGAIPAPNPDYPQDIDVVTGEQTVTISDGVSSQSCPISLGSTELRKIGDYQDYIYKSDGDWYVHEAIDKSKLGSLTWGNSATSTSGLYRMYTYGLSGLFVAPPDNDTAGAGLCSHFLITANNSMGSYGGHISLNLARNGDAVFIFHPDYTASTSGAGFKTWLTDNNVVFYYALKTPTDTQITDATLIGQLNAVHEWLTRYGYNATVTGALPIVLQRESLQ